MRTIDSFISQKPMPSLEEIKSYCEELGSNVNPNKFYEYYSQANWTIGERPIKDWKALLRSWDKRELNTKKPKERYWWHPKMAGLDDPQFVADLEAFMRG